MEQNRRGFVQSFGSDFSEIRLDSVQAIADENSITPRFRGDFRPYTVQIFAEEHQENGQDSREFLPTNGQIETFWQMDKKSQILVDLSAERPQFVGQMPMEHFDGQQKVAEKFLNLHEITSELWSRQHEIKSELASRLHEIESESSGNLHEVMSEFDGGTAGKLHETTSEFVKELHEIESESAEAMHETKSESGKRAHEIKSELAEETVRSLAKELRRAAEV